MECQKLINLLDNKPNQTSKFKTENCAQFINWIIRINDSHADDAHDIDIVMAMYNLIEFSDNYLKPF